MIVGPGNAGRPGVVDGLPAGVQFLVLTVEMVGVADAAEGTERDSQILMIARGQNAPTSLMEPGDRDAIVCTEAATNVDAEQPKLVEIGIVDLRQNRIVAVRVVLAIAGRDVIKGLAPQVSQLGQKLRQQGKAANGPIIFRGQD